MNFVTLFQSLNIRVPLILTCLCLAPINPAQAGLETLLIRTQQVLSGDVFIGTTSGRNSSFGQGESFYVHLAGIYSSPLTQLYGPKAQQALSALTANQTLECVITRRREKHLLARCFGNSGRSDLGLELLKDGLVQFNERESDDLSAVQRGSYRDAFQNARFRRKGMFSSGIYFTPDPTDFVDLNLDELNQQRTNGVYDERSHGFSKILLEASPKPSQSDRVQPIPKDWRTPIGRHSDGKSVRSSNGTE